MTFHSLDMKAAATRRLRHAIVASLLAHLLILWPAGVRVLTKDAPALLQATLRTPPPSPALPPPSPHAVPRAATPTPSGPRPESKVLERPQASSVPQLSAASAETAVRAPSVSEPAAVVAEAIAAPAGAAGPVSGSLVTDANASGEAVDGLRGYRLALATQARRFKRYPAQATASGWAGSVDIRVEVGSDGRPRPATVLRSSGYEVLDGAALTMIDAGALRARLPESLRGKAFAVVLPVVFNLDDE